MKDPEVKQPASKPKRYRARGAAVVAALLAPMLFSATVDAQTPGVVVITAANDVDITQVDLTTASGPDIQTASGTGPGLTGSTPIDIDSITLDVNGAPLVLTEFNTAGLTIVNNQIPSNQVAVEAYENGVITNSTDPGFEAAVQRVLSTQDFRDYLAYDQGNPTLQTTPVDFDVLFSAPLLPGDFVFVSERNGNTFFDLTPLDQAGNPIPGANAVGFNAPYAWNTTYSGPEVAGQPVWFTAADSSNFSATEAVWGFRVNNDGEADVKFWGASDRPFGTTSSIAGTVETDTGLPIAGVTIELFDDSGILIATATTDANGDYSFPNLRPGTYSIVESQPAGYGDTTDVIGDQGGTVANDQFTDIVLAADTDAVDYDFFETLGSIAGTVVVDANNDGVADAGETPIPGTTVTLLDASGAVVATAVTDANGNYLFDGLLAGTYTVVETQPAGFVDGLDSVGSAGGGNAVNDTIDTIVLGAGEASVDNDFTEIEPEVEPASIAGTVTDNTGAPIAGVTITLTAADGTTTTVVTDANGDYSFNGLAPGTYTVTETTPAGYLDGPDSIGSIPGDDTVNDVFSNIVLGAGDASVDNDFTEFPPEVEPASIAGTVTDNTGAPIAGVTITLTAADGTTTTVVTDANGDYSFDGLAPGTYTVTETTPAGYTDGPDSIGSIPGDDTVNDVFSNIVLGAGDASVDNDFTEFPPDAGASVAGTVTTDAGTPIPGVTLTLTGTDANGNAVTLTTTTDVNGDYVFAGLEPGTYTVTETQPAGFADGADTAGSAGGDDTANDIISEIVLGANEASVDNDFEETPPPVGPAPVLALTGVESRVLAAIATIMVLLGAMAVRFSAAGVRFRTEQ